jgi:hypothetical protein
VYVLVPDVVGVCADEPEVDCAPVHAPDAVQDVAFVDDQVMVDELPRLTFGWLNVSATVGADVVTTGTAGVAGVDDPPPHPATVIVMENNKAIFFLFISALL